MTPNSLAFRFFLIHLFLATVLVFIALNKPSISPADVTDPASRTPSISGSTPQKSGSRHTAVPRTLDDFGLLSRINRPVIMLLRPFNIKPWDAGPMLVIFGSFFYALVGFILGHLLQLVKGREDTLSD